MKNQRNRRRRPSKGVVIFSVILIVVGIIFFLATMVSFFQLRLELQIKDDAPFLFSQFPDISINSTVFWLSTLVSLIIMLCWIVSGVGMLFLNEWARQLLLISMGIYIINCVVNIFLSIFMTYEYASSIPAFALSLGITIVLGLVVSITYFFNHPAVIKQFKTKASHR